MMSAQSTDEWTEATFYFAQEERYIKNPAGRIPRETPWIVIHEVSVCEIVKGSDGRTFCRMALSKNLKITYQFLDACEDPYMIQTGTFTGYGLLSILRIPGTQQRENANMKLKVNSKPFSDRNKNSG